MECVRCVKRAGVIRSLGMERAQVAQAVAVYRVIRKDSGRESIEALCTNDVRGMRASGLFTLIEQ